MRRNCQASKHGNKQLFIFSSVWIVILDVILTCFLQSSETKIVQASFVNDQLCDLDKRLQLWCAFQVYAPTKSFLHCFSFCRPESGCVGVSMDASNICYLHYPCPSLTKCGQIEQSHRYKSKRCLNDGVFSMTDQSCKCVNLWVGPACQDQAKSCLDLLTSSYSTGMYPLYLDVLDDGATWISVVCLINDQTNHESILVFENSGTGNFDGPWTAYSNGYGAPTDGYWIGLWPWHLLSSVGYQTLIIDLYFGQHGYILLKYEGFEVMDRNHGYSFTFRSWRYTGNGDVTRAVSKIENCFADFAHTKFSTRDEDNDVEPYENCAAKYGAGWWFKECNATCFLFGAFSPSQQHRPSYQLIAVPGISQNYLLHNLTFVQIHLLR